MSMFASLSREQKQATILLQTGTFLEYFDLMLYVHMAVLLNDLFFPQADPHTARLLSAFAFCSTWVLRPLGALLFGYIGDTIGRKTTVILTTSMMAISCIFMAVLPTYAQIGLLATWAVFFCRVAQGLSSMGEIIGAELYLTEITQPPVRYPIVSLVSASSAFGAVAALGVATLATNYDFNWRSAFWIGAVIALVGAWARTRLSETPDFIEMKKRRDACWIGALLNVMKPLTKMRLGETTDFIGMKRQIERGIVEVADQGFRRTAGFVKVKTAVAYFMISCASPISFYFAYVYCSDILKDNFAFTSAQIIHQSLIVTLIGAIACVVLALLSAKVHPLTIQKYKMYCFAPIVLLCPFVLNDISSPFVVLLIQAVSSLLKYNPSAGVLLIHFPVFKRFTYTSFIYAFSRALMYIITSFGMVYLTEYLGHKGLLLIMVPMIIGFFWGAHHFTKLEKLGKPVGRLIKPRRGQLSPA